MDGHDVCIAEKIMQIAKRLLIGPDQKDPQVVFLIVLEIMQHQGLFLMGIIGKGVDLAVAVAGDVGDDRRMDGPFLETVNGHDRKDLINGPDIGQRLKEAEISVIDIIEQLADLRNILGDMIELCSDLGDLDQDMAHQVLSQRPLADVDLPMLEELAGLIAVVQGIVAALLDILGRHHLVGAEQVLHQAVWRRQDILGDRRRHMGRHVQDIEEQHRIIGDDGPAGFCDDSRMRDLIFPEYRDNGLDDIVAVFFDAVVTAGGEIGLRAVVVDGKTAAEVDEGHVRPFIDQLFIDPAGLHCAGADVADIGDLRADVVMEKLQAIEHFLLLQAIQDIHHMAHVQTENAGVAAGFRPVPLSLGRQLDAQPQIRLDAQILRPFYDQVDFPGDLDYEEALKAHLDRVQAQIDELFILIAIADQAGVAVVEHGDGGDQLRLAACLKAMVVFPAELRHRLQDLLLLIHLDRVNSFILAGICGLANHLPEGFVQQLDLGAEDIFHPQENGHGHPPFLHFPGYGVQADPWPVIPAERRDDHVPALADGKIIGTPVIDPVELSCVVYVPFFHG